MGSIFKRLQLQVNTPGKDNVIADALSRRAQDELGMGDRAAQNLCLLPPERFVKYIEAAPVINKSEFNEGVTSNNYVHDRLINAFFDSYASDKFYLTVSEWLNSDPSETPRFRKVLENCRSLTTNLILPLRDDKGSI